MKIFNILLYLILILSSSMNFDSIAYAATQYARIETSTEIYKTTSGSNSIDNIICIAEKSYFVEIIGDYDDYYRVNYNSISGYLKKNDVKEITNTPNTPYPYNIKITIGNNCNLRSSPTTNASTNNIITVLNKNETEITFIGRIYGEEAIDFGGSTWYYVNYNGYYGYVYNNYLSSITPIYENTEEFTYYTQNISTIENPITHTPSLIIIIILALPLIAILIILYLPKKSKSKTKKQKILKIPEKY